MARHPDPTSALDHEIPPPSRPTAWASLVYAIVTLALAFPALAGRFLINPQSDQFNAGFQFRDFAAQSLRSGHGIPQWNPFIQGGLPYVGAMHGDIFYPTALLRMIVPTDVAMTWEFPIHLFLCGLFTYFFLRAWKFGFYASLAGGLAYMLGGSIAGYASPGHDGKLFVSTILPLVLLLLTRGIRDGKLWAWGATAIAIGLAVLSPHPQLLQYLLLTAGAFALFIAFADLPGYGALPRDVAIKRLGLAIGAVAIGMLIGAVQYWPAIIEYKPWSPRAAGHDYATATSYSFPIEETLNWYLPQFSGILSRYWGRNGIHLHSDYFGVIVLMLAGGAFGKTGQKSFRRFWIVAGLVSLIWAYGGNTPVFHVILAIVPGTSYFRAPSTIIYVTAFAVAVLAAIGMERLLARRVSPKYAIGWAVGAAVFGLLISVGGYTALVGMVANAMANMYAPPEAHAQAVAQFSTRGDANAGAAILGAWRSFAFAAAGASVIWLFVSGRIAAKATAISLAALLAVDLLSIEREYWMFSDPASKLYASDPAVDAIKADQAKSASGQGRVLPVPAGSGLVPIYPAFTGDALWTHGLRVPGGYHGNELGMYRRLMQMDSGNVVMTPQFWRHENVQYLYTGADEQTMTAFGTALKIAGPITRLAGPVRDAAGSMVYSYKLPMDNPTSWVASAMVKAPQDQALATILDARFDPLRIAILDSAFTQIQVPPFTALPEPSANHTTVTAMSPGSYDIALEQPATAGQALVVSDNYFPGWHATANGQPAPVARANYNLIGIVLPAGARTVQLRFTDLAYEKGKVVTIIALLLAIALLGLGLAAGRTEQRRSRASA
jgi:hypothetical protein